MAKPKPIPVKNRPGLFFSPFISRTTEKRIVFSYNFDDVIKNQVYMTLYGLTTDSVKDSKLINYETGANADVTIDASADRICQTFTVGSSDIYIDSIELYGSSPGSSPWPNQKVNIQTTSAGKPTGVILTETTEIDFDSNSDVWVTCTIPRIRLKANVIYAIVMSNNDGEAAQLDYRADASSPTYTGGSVGTSIDSGASWTMDTGKDLYFRINGYTTNPYKLFPASGITSNRSATANIITSTAIDDLMIDIDFGFGLQRTIGIKGLALLEITIAGGYNSILLIKYDGTTETTLASADTDSSGLIALDITSLKTLKKGDILRLTVQVKADAIETATYSINHSGANLKLLLPVKLIGEI